MSIVDDKLKELVPSIYAEERPYGSDPHNPVGKTVTIRNIPTLLNLGVIEGLGGGILDPLTGKLSNDKEAILRILRSKDVTRRPFIRPKRERAVPRSATFIPVHSSVKWTVRDSLDARTSKDLGSSAFSDSVGPSLDFVPEPQFYELGDPTPEEILVYLFAEVQLWTDPVEVAGVVSLPAVSLKIPLPPIPVPRAPIAIPRLALLHIHASFAAHAPGVNPTDPAFVPGAGIVLVPGSSPLVDMAAVFSTAQALSTTIGDLKGVGGFPAWLTGLDALFEALQLIRLKNFVVAVSPVPDLDDYVLVIEDWDTNNIEGEDEVSALLCIGMPGQRTSFWNAPDFEMDKKEGYFVVEVGSTFFTKVSNLKSKVPATVPSDLLFVKQPSSDDKWWSDTLSSVRFVS